MKRILFTALLALTLSSCVLVASDDRPGTVAGSSGGGSSTSQTTVSGGFRLSISIRFSDYIRDFQPERGEGATYNRNEQIRYKVNVSRRGYVTLAIYDPEASGTNYVEFVNVPVDAGTNIIPRSYTVQSDTPSSRFYARAYFTTTPGPSNLIQGRFSRGQVNSRTQSYFDPFGEDTRDVAETYLRVR
jgi:Prokaryotic membrane lipoprotein lipid attachment site